MRKLALATLALFGLAHPGLAQPISEQDLPPQLKPWTRWVLEGVKDHGCTIVDEGSVCLWPGRLELTLGPGGGRFTQAAYADHAVDLPLPGDVQRWPQTVKLDGSAAPIVDQEGVPHVRLLPGNHRIEGAFEWRQFPDSIPVPKSIALVDLTIGGQRVASPQREEDGLLWLRREGGREAGENESLRLQVFRKLKDGIPLFVETNLLLEVSGKAREIELEGALLEGATAVAVSGDLPAHVEKGGKLRVQVRAGSYRVTVLARLDGTPKSVAAPRGKDPWPDSEIWAFEANELLRQVQVSGGNPVETSRTDLPEEWRKLPAYGLEAGGVLTLTELRRGEAEAPPDKLRLQRELWLDLDGRGYTVRDTWNGALSRTWRLDLLAPAELGRVAVASQDQLITKGAGGSNGVELRAGALEAVADSRLKRSSDLPAVGWSSDVESLSARLYLPPGWRVLGGSGIDSLPDAWVGQWTLLGFFFVLLVAFAAGRLMGWRVGLLALFAVGLSYHEGGAPFLAWLSLLFACALLRVASPGKLRAFAGAWRWLSLALLVWVLLPFTRDQVRSALYPQIRPGDSRGMAAYQGPSGGIGGSRSKSRTKRLPDTCTHPWRPRRRPPRPRRSVKQRARTCSDSMPTTRMRHSPSPARPTSPRIHTP